jgi:hypothetical protein
MSGRNMLQPALSLQWQIGQSESGKQQSHTPAVYRSSAMFFSSLSTSASARDVHCKSTHSSPECVGDWEDFTRQAIHAQAHRQQEHIFQTEQHREFLSGRERVTLLNQRSGRLHRT